jgi:hypothetical protein
MVSGYGDSRMGQVRLYRDRARFSVQTHLPLVHFSDTIAKVS